MTRQELIYEIKKKRSLLCIGLDTDIDKIPKHLLKYEDPVFEFNKSIIDATNEFAIAYKPNTAFYESRGVEGWISLEKTIYYLNKKYPNIFTISDAKRGDIGNTSKMYARAFFENMNFDAVTVAPYMGEDSVSPFLEYKDKWAIILALTSNGGAFDFQFQKSQDNKELYKNILEKTKTYGTVENIMYVVGATKAEYLKEIRKIVPNHFLLVPGVGTQGGDLASIFKYGLNDDYGLIINSSRSIIYADSSEHFAQKSNQEAKKIKLQIEKFL